MFGLTPEKIVIILVIAAFIIGPQRLPGYAAKLAGWVRSLKGFITASQERIKEEIGPEAEDIDWKKLDPRQYDPRRIIREALLEDEKPQRPAAGVQRVASRPLATAPLSTAPLTTRPLTAKRADDEDGASGISAVDSVSAAADAAAAPVAAPASEPNEPTALAS